MKGEATMDEKTRRRFRHGSGNIIADEASILHADKLCRDAVIFLRKAGAHAAADAVARARKSIGGALRHRASACDAIRREALRRAGVA